MIKSKFAQICDTALFVFGISIVVFAWVNKYIKMTICSLVITFILSFVLAKIIWSLSTNKINKKNLKTKELKFAQNCIDFLSLNPQLVLPFFNKLIDNSSVNGEYLYTTDSIYFFDYSSEQTTFKTLALLHSKIDSTHTKCYLYSSNISEKCKQTIGQTHVVWVKDYDCYLQMKEKNIFPISEQKNEKIQRRKFKESFKLALAKKKAKPYFFYGVLLLLTSFIMPYSLLYCVIGTISIVMALLCLLAKNNTSEETLS